MSPNHRILLLLAAVASASPLLAQSTDETSHEPLHPADSVLWDGTVPDNAVFADPTLAGRRDLNVNDPMIAPFMKLLGVYTDFVEKNLKGFDGTVSQREAAFHAVNLVLVTGVVWPPTMTAAGASIGAIALSETGPGALGGGVAGGVIGGAAGTGAMCAQVMLAVAMALELNDKYPEVGTRDLGMADGVDLPLFRDPEEWIVEDLLAAAVAGNGDGSEAVGERSLETNGRVTLQRARSASHAGQWESLFVHLIREIAAPQVDQLARHWQNYPGLSAAKRKQIEQFAGLRPLVEQIAYIRANGRLSGSSKPAMPLTTWQQRVTKLLRADSSAVQSLWLECFAIGNTRLQADRNKLTWVTPASLRRVGAPTSFSVTVPTLYPRVSGFGGSLSAAIEPGKFAIELGSAAISGDRIRVRFTIDKGRLLAAKVKAELGPAKHQFTLSPSLRRDLTGSLEFAVAGHGLRLTKVSLGRIDLNLGLPALPPPLKPLEGLLGKLEQQVESATGDLIGKKLGFEEVFAGLDKFVPKQVLEMLNRTADRYGLSEVQRLRSLALDNGKLEANVDALLWRGVPSLEAVARRYGAMVQQLAR
ncbi:MAG: hypothetical protein R3F56_11170 [Planctomycetota bacterium]